MSRWNICI